ncbi:hypothetical protein CBR_g24327 [Chara braunii]|uniref:carbonic anhydrase n=1 Tax=Chara braunii TaxID=69332 RepID=A0A388JMF2_CHABU|nr:hypothetical protein CBR_g24327 [Chara braunii]|eukprot:GBG58978.1 hypothetical protein CBR_g24327 [Chara braunii]
MQLAAVATCRNLVRCPRQEVLFQQHSAGRSIGLSSHCGARSHQYWIGLWSRSSPFASSSFSSSTSSACFERASVRSSDNENGGSSRRHLEGKQQQQRQRAQRVISRAISSAAPAEPITLPPPRPLRGIEKTLFFGVQSKSTKESPWEGVRRRSLSTRCHHSRGSAVSSSPADAMNSARGLAGLGRRGKSQVATNGEPSTRANLRVSARAGDAWRLMVTESEVIDGSEEVVNADQDVISRLKQGFVRFKRQKFVKEKEMFDRLAQGQEPKVMVIACADSRVCPTLLMGLEPGEVFAVRNVANLIPPWEAEGVYHGTSAALEFAVTGLQVSHVIVFGHSSCGGIRALLSRDPAKAPTTDYIDHWVQIGKPAFEKTKREVGDRPFDEQCSFCEKEAIKVSLHNLLTFPWVSERFRTGKLRLHGMYYDFVKGTLTSCEVDREGTIKGGGNEEKVKEASKKISEDVAPCQAMSARSD